MKTRLIPRTGRSFKDKLSESNSLALSCDAQSGGGEKHGAEEAHNHLFFFVYLGWHSRSVDDPSSVASIPVLSSS